MTALELARAPLPAHIVEALVQGDIGKLDAAGRVLYYNLFCERMGVDPMTQPFGYLYLNGKLVLYANKACAEQLRKRHHISITVTARENIGDCYMVTAHAAMPSGRVDESTGVVTIGNLKGDMLANALMKAETKAKRRVTLSIIGLGMIDETEIETIPGARIIAAAAAESDTFVPPTEQQEPYAPETLQTEGPTQNASAPIGAAAPPADETAKEDRQRLVRFLYALIDDYAKVGGERGAALKAKMRDTEQRHAFLLEQFGYHRLSVMPDEDVKRFASMVQQRIDECTQS